MNFLCKDELKSINGGRFGWLKKIFGYKSSSKVNSVTPIFPGYEVTHPPIRRN